MGPKFTLGGPALPGGLLAWKFWHARKYLPINIILNFQLRSSIHAGLTERSLYSRFALKNLPKWGFCGILGGGAKIFGGNPLGMQWPPIYVVWWKNYGDTINTLVCARGKGITKNIKNGMSTPCGLHFTPVQRLPPKPLVTPWCMWGPMGNVITHTLFQLNRFRG